MNGIMNRVWNKWGVKVMEECGGCSIFSNDRAYATPTEFDDVVKSLENLMNNVSIEIANVPTINDRVGKVATLGMIDQEFINETIRYTKEKHPIVSDVFLGVFKRKVICRLLLRFTSLTID